MHENASGPGTVRSDEETVEELRRLLARVDAAHEAQCQTLAHELHQKVVGSLSAVKMQCDWLLRRERTDDAVRARLQQLSEQVSDTIQHTRHLIHELWPAIVGHLGLSSAIQQQVMDARTRSAVSIDVAVDGDVDDIDEESAIALYRLAHQALAGCESDPPLVRAARIALHRTDAGVALDIEIDGSLAVDDAWRLTAERIERRGGQLEWRSAPAGKTSLAVLLPKAAG
jgi:signal transduction histidine kinase